MGTKHIDPALCIYLGAYLMCIDNKHLTDKVPRGNGTLCLWECLTAVCKALSLANAKGKGTDGLVIRS